MIIQEALDKALEPEEPRILTDAMRYSAIGTGKKIRPAVCLAACELVGGQTIHFEQSVHQITLRQNGNGNADSMCL